MKEETVRKCEVGLKSWKCWCFTQFDSCFANFYLQNIANDSTQDQWLMFHLADQFLCVS